MPTYQKQKLSSVRKVKVEFSFEQMTSKCGKNKKEVATEPLGEWLTDFLTPLWRLLWSKAEQTHDKMKSVSFTAFQLMLSDGWQKWICLLRFSSDM